MEDSDAAAELALLSPKPVTVTVGGRHIQVPPIKISGLAALIESCTPIMQWLAAYNFAAAMVNAPEAAVNFLVVGAVVEPKFIETLTLGESVVLASAIVDANADFFVHLLSTYSSAAEEKPTASATEDGSTQLSLS